MEINREIIIETLKENLHLEPMGEERVRVYPYVHKKDFPKVASAILSKLQKLKWDNIEKLILEHSIVKEIELKEGIKVVYRVIGPKGFVNIITGILSLIPEEGEVVAEGEIQLITEGFEGSLTGVYLQTKDREIPLNDILPEDKAIELGNTKVQIIIREVK